MIRIGVDFGGTKIEAAALAPTGAVVSRRRVANPGDYGAAIEAVVELVAAVEADQGAQLSAIGVGAPGSISPATGLMRNANSVWLNGMPFRQDLETALSRPVRIANDANCLALSEARDGAAAGAAIVFAAILGTGCGGGLVVNCAPIDGANGIAGEWGHTPLPWPTDKDKAPPCWCGRAGCLETYISGTGFEADYQRATGRKRAAPLIMEDARAGERWAKESFERYVDRLGRALAVIADIIDPDVIVLAGGMSNVVELYDQAPDAVKLYVFSDIWTSRIVPAEHGDSSGVRGAAWLWPLDAATARQTAPA